MQNCKVQIWAYITYSKRTLWNRRLLCNWKKTTPYSLKNHYHLCFWPHSTDLNFLPLAVSSTFSFLTLITFELGSLWLPYAEVLTAGKNVKRLAQPATGVTQRSGEWSVASNSIWQDKESMLVCTCINFLQQFFNAWVRRCFASSLGSNKDPIYIMNQIILTIFLQY